MARTTSYAAEILQRDPEAREFNFGLLVLVLVLLATRVPFVFSATTGSHQLEVVQMLADGAAIASGETYVVAKTVQPRLDAYVVAFPLYLWRLVSYNHLSAQDFQALVARQSREVIMGLGVFAFVIWLLLSLVVFTILRQKIDETVARFAFWMMIWSPAGMVAVGAVWPAVFVSPLVFFVLLCCATTIQRADTKVYLGTGVAIAIATGFGYHHLLLFLPFLYAHFFTQRQPRENFLGLIVYPRLIGTVIVFLLVFAAVHPQLWPITGELKKVNDFTSFKGMLQTFIPAAPFMLFGDNGLPRQGQWLYGPPTMWTFLKDIGSLLGSVATLIALFAAMVTLFRQDQRPWRPMTLYVYLVLLVRLMSPLPGLGWTLVLVPPLVVLLTVNILPIVGRFGYRRERVVYVVLGLLLCLQPGYLLVNRCLQFGSRSTADLARMELTMKGYGPKDIYHLATYVHGERKTTRNPRLLPNVSNPEEAYALWARRLPAVQSLRKKKYRYVLIDLKALKKLQTLCSGDEAARVSRVITQFENLRQIKNFSPKEDGSVTGPVLELLSLAR